MKLKDILSHCEEHSNYPEVFDINSGVGLEINEKGEEFKTIKSWKDKRNVILNITTFIGISSNAIHYYGKIEIDGVHCTYVKNPQCSSFLDDLKYPLASYKYHIELIRVLTKEEIESDQDRWGFAEEGESTSCFETMDELISLFKEIKNLRFKGKGWKFFINYPNGSKIELK